MNPFANRSWSAILCACVTLFAVACASSKSSDQSGGSPETPNGAELKVGPAGGTLTLADVASVEIPANALDEETTLRAAPMDAAKLPVATPVEALGTTVELTPHGRLFETPITVRLNYKASAAPELLRVMRLDDPSDPDWEVVEGATFLDGVATFESSTFSYYTVVVYPDPACGTTTSPVYCGGVCTPEQYCRTAGTCATILGDNLCGNSTIYALRNGFGADEAATDSMSAALAAHCGGTPVNSVSSTDPAVVDTCTGEPLVGAGNTLLMAGGFYTQRAVLHLERRISPIYFDTDGGTLFQYKTRAGAVVAEWDVATQTSSHGFFTVALYPDTKRGSLVINVFGQTGEATLAGAWYFANVVLPSIENGTKNWGKYVVVEWTDSGDLAPNAADSFIVRGFDPAPPPPPVTETPWQSNVNGTLGTPSSSYYAMGYKFTPQVPGKITALGGYFGGTKTVKLFQGSTVLATASVASNKTWAYTDITPVSVVAGTQYTVAVYLAGSGGTQRTSIASLPRTYGSVRIDAATQASTLFNASAVPTSNFTPNTTMLGQPDVKFIKN